LGSGHDEHAQAPAGEGFAQNRRHAAANGVADDGLPDGLADRDAYDRGAVAGECVGAIDGKGAGGDPPATLTQARKFRTTAQAGQSCHQTVRR